MHVTQRELKVSHTSKIPLAVEKQIENNPVLISQKTNIHTRKTQRQSRSRTEDMIKPQVLPSGYLICNKRKILLPLWEKTIIKLGQIISQNQKMVESGCFRMKEHGHTTTNILLLGMCYGMICTQPLMTYRTST